MFGVNPLHPLLSLGSQTNIAWISNRPDHPRAFSYPMNQQLPESVCSSRSQSCAAFTKIRLSTPLPVRTTKKQVGITFTSLLFEDFTKACMGTLLLKTPSWQVKYTQFFVGRKVFHLFFFFSFLSRKVSLLGDRHLLQYAYCMADRNSQTLSPLLPVISSWGKLLVLGTAWVWRKTTLCLFL